MFSSLVLFFIFTFFLLFFTLFDDIMNSWIFFVCSVILLFLHTNFFYLMNSSFYLFINLFFLFMVCYFSFLLSFLPLFSLFFPSFFSYPPFRLVSHGGKKSALCLFSNFPFPLYFLSLVLLFFLLSSSPSSSLSFFSYPLALFFYSSFISFSSYIEFRISSSLALFFLLLFLLLLRL